MSEGKGAGDRFPWERPLGAWAGHDGTTEFRLWAPRAETITLSVAGSNHDLKDAGYGVYEATVPAAAGDDYVYRLDGRELPDPCSRWQASGLRGPSRVAPHIRPLMGFDAPTLSDLVIYELHIGTFSESGTFEGAIEHLDELTRLGVNAIEIMPVAEFPGARGWGYDGVYISAAQSSYGGPQGLARLVQAAHERGLAMILDVVYNHLGAEGGEAVDAFGPYFTAKYETPWGKAINYDDADCDPVREWVCQSAEGWIRDFGIDGLRLDAIHAIFDSSAEHIVAAVARRVHAVNPRAYVIAESGLNDPRVMRSRERGGYECDATWADDFHHALRTLITDERDGYYADFGRVAQLAKAFHRPHVDDGDYSRFRRRRFGAPAEDVPPKRFVVFSQNHDQVGNRAFGDRMPEAVRPLAALCTVLSPFTPQLFMGEEYGEAAPFQYFSSHLDRELGQATREGRRAEFASFASFAEDVPDPEDPETFERSKLTRVRDERLVALYRDLIALRGPLGAAGTEAQDIAYDEEARWLSLRRGPYQLICNFASGPVSVPCQGTVIEISAGGEAQLGDGHLKLPSMSGALIR